MKTSTERNLFFMRPPPLNTLPFSRPSPPNLHPCKNGSVSSPELVDFGQKDWGMFVRRVPHIPRPSEFSARQTQCGKN